MTHGFWKRVGDFVAKNPVRVTVGSVAVLLVMSAGLAFFSTDLTTNDSYRTDVESVDGQELLSQSFPAGASAPIDIVVPNEADVPSGHARSRGRRRRRVGVRAGGAGRARRARCRQRSSRSRTRPRPSIWWSRSATRRTGRRPGRSSAAPSAVEFDVREAAAWDSTVIPPIVLLVVFLILVLLLRALIAPLVLIGTVILSFLAALGVGYFVFDVVFDFPGSDPSLPLFAFVFLVALGVDYNIFLLARAREETLTHGTREGMLRALAVTGGVITSAGIVLAGTFSVLAVLPLVFLTEIGFVVAFGVLLDTFLVRSVLVPALVLKIGPKVWWPSALAKEDRSACRPAARAET